MKCRPFSVCLVALAIPGLWSATGVVASDVPASPPPLSLPGSQPPETTQADQGVPALPGAKTAADTFRELLAMTPAERARALASRSEYNRKYLEGRLREYEALPAAERELRLKQLELNCHLPDLMKMPPAKRAGRLALVPGSLRPLIEERLQQWDLLPPDVQRDVLEHQTTASLFLRVRPGPGLPPLPGEEPPSKQAETFKYFFELPPNEQEKTLGALPAKEREGMEKTLQLFAKLPPEQRQTCINSFLKFSRMSKEQRDQFLKNAARWQAMSPEERATWRTLVRILPSSAVSDNVPPLPKAPEPPKQPTTASNESDAALGGR